MQSGKYGVGVVVDGKLISERADGLAAIPYGAEYSIRLRNNSNRRAVAVVYIDNVNISSGGFIVDAHSVWDVERPTDKQAKFRFVSSNSGAAYAAGKAGEDVDGTKGLIRVEWRAETSPPFNPYLYNEPFDYTVFKDYSRSAPRTRGGSEEWTAGTLNSSRRVSTDSAEVKCLNMTMGDCGKTPLVSQSHNASPALGTGVTVDGGRSNQGFTTVKVGTLEEHPTVIQLKLMGYNPEQGRPATGTNYCPACRTKTTKATDRFCRSCGEKF